ncbi:hypothetical protein FQA39_LY01057 [Lamprigera yunnana]|nr:hypothetical protein FQA39_LY01057 [Lamprigera yunnana]
MQHTAKVCGISINTLTTIKKRFNEVEIENEPVECLSKRPRCKPKSVDIKQTLKVASATNGNECHNYFGRKRDNGGAFIPFTSVMQRTAKVCGISINTLTTIKKRFNEVEIENEPVECLSKRPRCKPKSVDIVYCKA